MDPAWEVLERAGVPCGAARSERPDLSDLAAVAAAAREVLGRRERLDERQRVSLLSWLRAWASSFPTLFGEAFGDGGEALLAQAAEGLEGAVVMGRYLKLRRIAREKLLRVL